MQNNSNYKFLILSDYNLPNIQWVSVNNSITPNLFNTNNFDSSILASLLYVELTQHSLIYNNSGSLLDLVLSNINNINVSSVMHSLVLIDHIYHTAWFVKTSVLLFELSDFIEQIYDFANFNYFNIRSQIALIDCNGIFANLNINEAVYIFYEIIF